MSENKRATDKQTDVSSKHPPSPTGTATASPKRLRLRLVAATAIVMLIAWRTYADRDFWRAALSRRSVRSGVAAQQSSGPSLTAVQTRSAFDLSRATVPVGEIRSGGPRKDGIPALSSPKLISAKNAAYLKDEDRVIGVVIDKDARAYPLRILDYHEIVNDRVGNAPVAVTYCPLCDSCAVFDRRTELGEREFGVSGMLYNSNVLMYDRKGQPESLWSQVMTKGVSGPAAGKSLRALPLELTTWKDWRSRYPETKVVSNDTGHPRDYNRRPYGGYFETPQLMFPVKPTSKRLPTKARVLGVWTGKSSRAFPESSFGRDRLRIEDSLDGKKFVIEFNPESKSFRVAQADDGVHWMYSLWFAWYAMRPGSDVFQP